jgi:hypothetical protein
VSLPTNLATRPFYNERAAQAIIAVIGALVALATVLNLWQIVDLTERDRRLGAERTAAEARIDLLRRQAGRARTGLDGSRVAAISEAVREANAVIDGRTFSWTALLNWLETALPADVRITAIRPRVDTDGRFVLGLTIEGRDVAAIDTFLTRLESTGRFEGLLVRTERETESGTIEATTEGFYRRDAVTTGGTR